MFYSNIREQDTAPLIDESAVKECKYNDFEEATYMAMAENEINYNKLVEAIGIMESNMQMENGEVVYTENVLSSVWTSLKNFLKKVWEKIVALFKRFVAMFDQFFMNDKDFLKKYRARIMQSSAKDLEFKGYTFSGVEKVSNMGSELGKSLADVDKVSNDATDEKITEYLDGVRGNVIGAGKTESGDYISALKEVLYGSDSAEDLSNIDLGKQMGIIESAKDDIKKMEKTKKDCEKFFKDMIKKADDSDGKKAKEAAGGDKDKEGDLAKKSAATVKVYRGLANICTATCGQILQAYKDRNRQARAICVKAIAKSGKFNNEAAGFDYPAYGGTNFLAEINFK